jgi:threonine/homoserine/homoserine lactone efflux protein
MTLDALLATSFVMLVGAATPGPNNVLAMQAGACGTRASSRVIAGVVLGSVALIAVAWFGGIAMFHALPWLRTALAILGSGYLGWLGVAIATRSMQGENGAPRASTVAGIAALQLVNPKAWMIAVAITAAPVARTPAAFAALIVICSAIPAVCLVGWAAVGGVLDRVLGTHRRSFAVASGGLLVVSAAALLIEGVR